MHRYVYLGDKLTDPRLVNQPCDPILRADGKVLRGRNRNAAVRFADGTEAVVLGRHLRLTSTEASDVDERGEIPPTTTTIRGDACGSERRPTTTPDASMRAGRRAGCTRSPFPSTRMAPCAQAVPAMALTFTALGGSAIAPSTPTNDETRQHCG